MPVLPAAVNFVRISSTPSIQRCCANWILPASAHADTAAAFTFNNSVLNASRTAACVVGSNVAANALVEVTSLAILPNVLVVAWTASTDDSPVKEILSPLLNAASRPGALSVTDPGDKVLSYLPRAYSLCGPVLLTPLLPGTQPDPQNNVLTPADTHATVTDVAKFVAKSLLAILFLPLLISSFISSKAFLSHSHLLS